MPNPARHTDVRAIDPRLDEALRCMIAIGAVLVLLLPAARGSHAAIGWLPLWLLAMPASAWWALHRFRLPRRAADRDTPDVIARAARRGPQARRRPRALSVARLPRAA